MTKRKQEFRDLKQPAARSISEPPSQRRLNRKNQETSGNYKNSSIQVNEAVEEQRHHEIQDTLPSYILNIPICL